jgi:hypothetical protein
MRRRKKVLQKKGAWSEEGVSYQPPAVSYVKKTVLPITEN